MKNFRTSSFIYFLLFFLFVVVIFLWKIGKYKNIVVGEKSGYEIISKWKKEKAFTQGFEIDNNYLYESSGLYGKSFLRKINLEAKKVEKEVNIKEKYFAEGLTIFKDKVYLLTWKSGKVLVYNKNNLTKIKEFQLPEVIKEGWGLASNANTIYLSDGTNKIWKINPDNFKVLGSVEAKSNYLIKNINELEWVNGKIYANIWFQNKIIIINPENGEVEKEIFLNNIYKKIKKEQVLGNDDVLNGIAYNKKNKSFLITGKNWSKNFEIKLK